METNTNETRIRISLKEGVFELTGSETFVSQQIENFKTAITASLTQIQQECAAPAPMPEDKSPAVAPAATKDGVMDFPNVLHIEGEKVTLLKTMPGSTKSKRAVSTALVYLWGKQSVGVENVTFKELRDLCKQQGCLDEGNFANQMTSAKPEIVIDGTRGSSLKVCKLTRPGIDAAWALLKELNESPS
jgi:hypothetical protein